MIVNNMDYKNIHAKEIYLAYCIPKRQLKNIEYLLNYNSFCIKQIIILFESAFYSTVYEECL